MSDAANFDVPKFQVWDYVVFGAVLLMSAGIGVYHAFAGGRQSTTKEFLLADKKMSVWPVAMSMLASFMSAITLMGNPAEIYNYGTQFIMIGLSYSLVIPAAAHLYMPIFYNLNLTSAYEYLELRFSKGVRLAACITFILQMVFYMAIVLYAPALALNQVTGLNVWISVLSVGLVCTFYTTLGGMKAVMYTDLIQIVIMFSGMTAILIKGSLDVGGFQEVWKRAGEGDRLELFNFDPDPRVRHTFWSLFVGATFTWLAIYGVNQAQVQRALSTPSLKHAQIALYLNIPGLIFLLIITVGCGLVIYANYQGCDPVQLGVVQSADQLVPLFVMKSLGAYPGVPGLFVSAIFSGALSTLSSGFNSLSAIVLQDIIKSYFMPNMSEVQATRAAKGLAMGFGALCIGLSYVASYLGGVLQAALALFGIVGGPLLGLFSLAFFFPWANWKGAYAGLFTSLATTLWVGLGAILVYKPINPLKPLSVELCSNLTSVAQNVTMAIEDTPPIADWYATSYLYYSIIAIIVCVTVGMCVSLATGPENPREMDPRLITPILAKIFCCVPDKRKQALWCGVPHDKVEEKNDEKEQMEPMATVAFHQNGHINEESVSEKL
ncbi:sodium-coupled monocarboxylate transporter 2-like [Watersipora subatra]|uniref:sodium-coupled monocarboxylate transporter 2-like n=1 Tax=Watersipora subatra TaxID=2589382 RepID=UPI00355C8AD5